MGPGYDALRTLAFAQKRETWLYLLEVRDNLRRARLAVLFTSPRAKGLTMCPLHSAVLIAVELLGLAAEVAGEGRHGVGLA